MIPYDDLVVALATWRARQGLPVAQPAGAPPRAPAPPPPAARTAPPSAPARTTTPKPAVAPKATLSTVSTVLQDFDDGEGALGEDGQYDPGNDYAVPFGGEAIEQAGEATAIGGVPEDPTEGLLQPKRGKRNPDW